MPVSRSPDLDELIISILKRFSGRRSIESHQMIGRDVGINGGDGVEVVEELEERFGVDLNPLIDAHTVFPPPTWSGRLLGREHGSPYADLTVGELIDYIAGKTGHTGAGPQA